MLDPQFIRDNIELLRVATKNKQQDPAILDEFVKTDLARRTLLVEIENLRSQKNKLGKDDREKAIKIKSKLKDLEPQLKDTEIRYADILLRIPNPAAADVPIGEDERGNKVVKQWGTPRKFDFQPKRHFEVAKDLDIFESERAVRIAGFRGYYLKGDLVLLEQAVLLYAQSKLIKENFIPMSVPCLVNKDALVGTGYFPWGEADHYQTQDGQILVGTAEVPLTAFHKDEVLSHKDLPVKYCAISSCYRREIGHMVKTQKDLLGYTNS